MNIRFPKDKIARAERYDFSDDGNSFRGYLYKGTIPITYLRKYGEVFCSIRLDYLMSYLDYRDSEICYDRFNGVDPDRFNMQEFLDICEKSYQFYTHWSLPESKLNRVEKELARISDIIDEYKKQKIALLKQVEELKRA